MAETNQPTKGTQLFELRVDAKPFKGIPVTAMLTFSEPGEAKKKVDFRKDQFRVVFNLDIYGGD
ncbi:unnamed protein product, partial [marine sediment metagenome]